MAGEGVSPGGIGYREIATRAINELSTEMIVTNSYKSDSNPGSYAVNFAEAEVDTLTGLVRVTDFLSVNDIGQAINRQMVYNQISGGVQMAAGFALCEDLGINSKGVPTKDSLKKYNTLNAADMPAVKTILVEEGGDKGPFGAKSIGEISTVPGAAAIVNAVNNALGTAITELPLTPERIVEALDGEERRAMLIEFELNGKKCKTEADPSTRLIDFLREEMGLTGAKEGCGEGECGTCTVIVDRKAVHSCLMLTGQIDGRSVLTVEGLAGENGELSPLQAAFIKHGAIQCGYCTPGMLMSAAALLYENPDPTEDEIRTAIAGNLCRCGDYSAIAKAVKEAAEVLRRAKEEAISHE